ncbi:MAG: cysteine desulfurase [Dehalococcoidia bacterium]|nr:cysteine desulfurase [Dehalococcoidia bacterium]|tara:strand:- start:478 stop:1722 length:1245 start_codon:yes stop_codon:yes gene_type:complete
MSKDFDVNKIRQDFPILDRTINGNKLAYLDNASSSQKPREVIQCLVDYYENYNSNVHRGVHTLSMEATDLYETARTKVANFIGAKEPNTIVWTRGTTEAINLVAFSWGFENIGAGDAIVVSQMEHHSNLVTWQLVATRQKAELRVVPLTDNQTLDMEALADSIDEKVKLVSICHASNSVGSINPVKKIARKAHAVGAKILVDGAQSVPHMPIDVADLDCDFLTFSGHKMLAPMGIGVLYAKQEILESMEPFMRGGDMVLEVWNDKATWNSIPNKFEAGTPNVADAIGLGAAIDYLTDIGMDNIRAHEIELTDYALQKFKQFEELDVYGPTDTSIRGGIIPFHSEFVHPHDIGTILDRSGIAIRTGHHCTMPLMRSLGISATARASFYIYNTIEEIDRLVDAIDHTLKYFSTAKK